MESATPSIICSTYAPPFLLALILYSISTDENYESGLLETFVVASLKTPNPLGKFYYTLIQNVTNQKRYLEYYKKHIRSVARSHSMADIFGVEMTDNTIENLIDAFHNQNYKLIKSFQGSSVSMVVKEVIQQTKLPFPIDPFDACYRLDVPVIYLDLPRNIDGLTFKNTYANRGIIALNVHYNGSVREKFTLAHELGHFLLHNFNENELVLSNKGFFANVTNSSTREREANQFAELLLVPEGSEGERALKKLDPPFMKKISVLSNEWGISNGVLISRLVKATSYSMRLSIYNNDELVYKEDSGYWGDEELSNYSEEKSELKTGLQYKITYNL